MTPGVMEPSPNPESGMEKSMSPAPLAEDVSQSPMVSTVAPIATVGKIPGRLQHQLDRQKCTANQ